MAAPHPDDEMARLQKLCKQGLPAVTVVTGTNDFFRAEAMELLLAAVPPDAELRRIDAVDERAGGGGGEEDGDDDGEESASSADAEVGLAQCPELMDLRGGGLFARSTIVCIRRGKNWWDRYVPTLAAQIPKFGKGCGLLLEATKLDKRKKVAAQLVKSLSEAGALFEFRDLYETPFDRSRSPAEGELAKWVARRSGKLGVALSPEASWLIVAQVGKSLPELAAELGRLRDQLGADPQRKPLQPSDLHGRLTCSFESTPFELAEAVLSNDKQRALRSVRAMFDRGVRGKDGKQDTGGVFPFATSWLWRSLAKAHEGRQMLDRGVSPRDVAAKLGVFQFAERFVEQVQKNNLVRLRRGLLALHHCARQLRLTGEEPDLLLERFLGQWFDGRPIPRAEDLEL
jgi:DNA polymerase III delta subunit